MANFLVYDFIMATQTESNDVGLSRVRKSQSRVHPFTISRPPPLASFPPTRMKYHHYVSASKGCRGIFNIRGRPPRFRFFTLGLTIPIPFFRLRGRPRVMRIQILSPRSVETNFADAWTLSVRRNFVCSVKVCEWGKAVN